MPPNCSATQDVALVRRSDDNTTDGRYARAWAWPSYALDDDKWTSRREVKSLVLASELLSWCSLLQTLLDSDGPRADWNNRSLGDALDRA